MKKTLLALFMFTIMVFTGTQLCIAETYSGTCGENLTWVLDEEGTLTISGSGEMYNDAPWQEIYPFIKSVIIPYGVTTIGNHAFGSFYNLSNITLPNSITDIGEYAFSDCSSLLSIDIPDSVTSIGNYAFFECSSLKDMGKIPSNLVYLGNNAFSGCSSLRTEIALPENVTSIGKSTFEGCSSLTKISIPDDVASIGANAFRGCSSLTDITIPDGIISIEDYTFYNCSNLTNVIIPNSVTSIGKGSFYGCNNITDLLIPDNVTFIDDFAFSMCSNLSYIYIPEGVTRIGYNLFGGCENLIGISIPNSITYIDDFAFSNCLSLTNIDIPNGVTSIGNNSFSGCSSLTTLNIPDSVTSIGSYAFFDCDRLKNITTSCNIKNIGDYAFHGCRSLSFISLPTGLTEIGYNAFENCVGLKSISIPGSVSSVPNHAFYNCSNLTYVTVSDGVSKIEDYAFAGCVNLTTVLLSESVTAIDYGAFSNCTKLDYIEISSTNIIIENEAFPYVSPGYIGAPYVRSPSVVFWGNTASIGSSNFSDATIYCYEYSDVDYWATEQGIPIVYLDNFDIDSIRKINIPESLRIACGTTQTVQITIFPCQDDPEVIWYSSDNSVISVDDGIISANMLGTAVISVTVGSVTANMNVSTYVLAEDFDLPHDLWIITKNTSQLSISNVTPEGAEVDITWSSSDESIATVDSTGLLTAKKPGDAIISAADVSGLSKTTTVHVCYPVTAIEIQPADPLRVGQTLQLTANVTMRTQSCVNHLISFTSSDETIASVDENGLVTALSVGTVEITATAESGLSASCSITVNDGFEAVLNLPVNLREINSEAFSDLASVEAVRIPNTVTTIADDAFNNSNITIIASAGSYAIQWAEDHGIPYVEE